MQRTIEVAEYFLWLACQEGDELISNMKLQKLIYYAQGFHLAKYGRPLFDGIIEAWNHGPVVPEIYDTYKEYGAAGIPCPDGFRESKYKKEVCDFLNGIYGIYGQFSAPKLRQMTHDEPLWSKVTNRQVINISLMRDYFLSRSEVRPLVVQAHTKTWEQSANEILKRRKELWERLAKV